LVAPVAPFRFDQVAGEDLARVEGDDRDVDLVDDREDARSGMGGPGVEMVQAAGPAQGQRTLAVGAVVAEPEVAAAGPGAGGLRPGDRRIRLGEGDPAGRPMRAVLVVVGTEGVELGLEPGARARGRLTPERALQGLLEALDLALRLGDDRGRRSSGGCRARRAGTRTRCGRR
jgi:hypothetical protein